MITNADIAETKAGYVLRVTFVAPTLGWTDVDLAERIYVTAPADGLQGVDIVATPPNGFAPAAIELFPLQIEVADKEWFDGFRIFSPNGDSLRLYGPKSGDEPYSKPVRVQSAALRGDKLILNVSYSGGCAEHKFRLTQKGGIMKSIPPQVVLEVTEDDNGDACEMIVDDQLQFDLSAMDIFKQRPFIIHIANSAVPPLRLA